jgi:hypothetical protein
MRYYLRDSARVAGRGDVINQRFLLLDKIFRIASLIYLVLPAGVPSIEKQIGELKRT